MDKNLIDKIIELEWEMFSSVPNSGRRAACQEDRDTFSVMRYSQACEWPQDLLVSYYDDLLAARREERNLMTEKYAWMMASAFPEEYRKIVHLLPAIDEETSQKIEEIVAIHVDWKLAVNERYPKLGKRGRAVHSGDDSHWDTSFETYLRGELKTYSSKTISILHRVTMLQKTEGINGVERDLLQQVLRHGFTTLEQAEQHQYHV
jgi:hypothetical protein